MGSVLSQLLAEIYLDWFENKVVNVSSLKYFTKQIFCYYRYVES